MPRRQAYKQAAAPKGGRYAQKKRRGGGRHPCDQQEYELSALAATLGAKQGQRKRDGLVASAGNWTFLMFPYLLGKGHDLM